MPVGLALHEAPESADFKQAARVHMRMRMKRKRNESKNEQGQEATSEARDICLREWAIVTCA
jgi:hypothetical protein